jgi:hypothetical protein
MQPWTRFVLFRTAPGLGFAVTLGLILGGTLLYQARPQTPKAWNTSALTATFDGVGVEGADHRLAFYYVVENNTGLDYQLPDHFDVSVMSKLKGGSLSFDNGAFKADDEMFLPAKMGVRFAIHTKWRCPDPVADPSANGALTGYVAKIAPDLDGFVLFDQRNRYQIDLPKGWPPATAALTP